MQTHPLTVWLLASTATRHRLLVSCTLSLEYGAVCAHKTGSRDAGSALEMEPDTLSALVEFPLEAIQRVEVELTFPWYLR